MKDIFWQKFINLIFNINFINIYKYYNIYINYMNKRKANQEQEFDLNQFDNLSKKKYKQSDKWISGTSVANYLIGEPLIDWLNLYYDRYE